MKRMIFGMALSSFFVQAQAADNFVVAGSGATSCGQYVMLTATKEGREDIESWVQGYLSGMNMVRHEQGHPWKILPDRPTIKLYLDKYCRENPLSSPSIGAGEMFTELSDDVKR